jgi:hypothetical protein
LKTLLAAATRDGHTLEEKKGWGILVHLVQHIFATGEIPQELSWSILVVIPKDSGGMQGNWFVGSGMEGLLFHNQ